MDKEIDSRRDLLIYFFIIGCGLLIIGLGVKIGGGIEIKEIIPPIPRIIAFILGELFIFLSIYKYFNSKSIVIVASGFLLFVILILFVLSLLPEKEPVDSKYDFEKGTGGWVAQYWEKSQACTGVNQSNEKVKKGNYSLKMEMNLSGGHPNNSNGGVWVDMVTFPPNGVTIPTNLEGKKITAWVYAPLGSRGNRDIPNGFQIFVIDRNGNSEWGSWFNVVEGEWFQISLTPSISIPPTGGMSKGFNPKQINAVGVLMGTGNGSTATYNGSIYIDAVDW